MERDVYKRQVDDSHAVGFVGAHGRGTAEHCGVEGRVDIITGTLGKALGGASGGYTSCLHGLLRGEPLGGYGGCPFRSP